MRLEAEVQEKEANSHTHMTYIRQAGNLSPDNGFIHKVGVGPEESSSSCSLNPDSKRGQQSKAGEEKYGLFFRLFFFLVSASSSRS